VAGDPANSGCPARKAQEKGRNLLRPSSIVTIRWTIRLL
jgi:hypothetical protein